MSTYNMRDRSRIVKRENEDFVCFSKKLVIPSKGDTPKHWEDAPVTVCVASICDGNTVIGASDRMITSDDIEFEPEQPKVYSLTTSLAMMIAGDSGVQIEIFQEVAHDIQKRIEAEPQNWWSVKEVVNLYCGYYDALKTRTAEREILVPLGLTRQTFLSEQKTMSPQLVDQIASELVSFKLPDVETIFTGIDLTGAHIYVFDRGKVRCKDGVGFAAIGIGAWHAASQLMFAGHSRFTPMSETLLETFFAKKRAEVAPGVGKATDMFIAGPSLGTYASIGTHVIATLEHIFKRNIRNSRASEKRAKKDVDHYIQAIIAASTAVKEQKAIPKDPGGDKAIEAGIEGEGSAKGTTEGA